MEDIVEDRPVLYEDRFLLEQGHRDVFVDPDGTPLGGILAGEDPQEGGFAAAVAGDQGDLVAFFNVERDIAKKRLYAV
jgi:hypothetical protein